VERSQGALQVEPASGRAPADVSTGALSFSCRAAWPARPSSDRAGREDETEGPLARSGPRS
jgi:hypothetical protein